MTRKKQKKQGFFKWLLFIFVSIIFLSCNSSKPTEGWIDTGYFRIQFPADSVSIVKTESPLYGQLIWGQGTDTFYYQFGYLVDRLVELEPRVIYAPIASDDSSRVDTTGLILANEQYFDIDNYRQQNVYFQRINGYRAKITEPRKTKGITGVYFDSLREDGLGTVRFSLFARDLDIQKIEALKTAIRSIQFNADSLTKKKNFVRYYR